jgi:beta-lactamase class C
MPDERKAGPQRCSPGDIRMIESQAPIWFVRVLGAAACRASRLAPLPVRLVTASISALALSSAAVAGAVGDTDIERLVTRELAPIVAGAPGGIAVTVRISGRTLFFNYGLADIAANRPITSDSLFNLASLRKLFEVTLLTRAVERGELGLDDLVAEHVVELQQGDYIRTVTLGQIATHTSGLLLRSDYPPWPERRYSLAEFLGMVNAWAPDKGQQPGKQHIYSNGTFMLLQLALERRYGMPIGELINRYVLKPLGMNSTVLGARGADGRGELPPALMARAVQGYTKEGQPMGAPGDQEGYYDIPGTEQMFSSARDMAALLSANLGELPIDPTLREAMRLTQSGIFKISPRNSQALAWEINDFGGPIIVDKPGGLENSSTYIGMVPARRVGLVILSNCGYQHPYEIARRSLLPALASR